ncbi:hypothetical protein DDZ13_06565 [Coraliomargarita sinensis]|uniref:BrnT family toxin n=1 Tax=Coraliomargarita sinensis TaxID=2174842 RepID=A0A317ZGZ3_9BACT|nr:hypothetical protein DDZ13_06565 [Coraliomargarita sinensis]
MYGDYEWHEPKNTLNRKKHGIDFREAVSVFDDERVMFFHDEKHSTTEDRFYAVGRMANGEIITVRFTMRERVRIFGANKVRKHRKYYEGETAY